PRHPSGGVAVRCLFLQGEGGIRDRYVTGVQTCALPISGHGAARGAGRAAAGERGAAAAADRRGVRGDREGRSRRGGRRLPEAAAGGPGRRRGEGGTGDGLPHAPRSEEHTSELQSRFDLVCRLLLEKKKGTGTRAV